MGAILDKIKNTLTANLSKVGKARKEQSKMKKSTGN